MVLSLNLLNYLGRGSALDFLKKFHIIKVTVENWGWGWTEGDGDGDCGERGI